MLVLASFVLLSTKTTKTTKNFTQLPCDADLSLLSLPPLPEEPNKQFENGTRFYGSFNQNNKLTGKGILEFPNGNRYDGEFKNGKRTGCGRYSYLQKDSPYEYYIGQYVKDQPNGVGRLRWKNGNEYRGNFKDSKCEGEGIFQSASGSSKSGVWKKGDLLKDKNISCN
ncbi:MAG: hypothetical protein V7K47_22620 [Nostoc sp.]